MFLEIRLVVIPRIMVVAGVVLKGRVVTMLSFEGTWLPGKTLKIGKRGGEGRWVVRGRNVMH